MNKILTLSELPAWREELRKKHHKLVVTNGVFDILHRGHAQYLQDAAAFGDELLICINSDRAVHELKGATRPINHEQDRAFMLTSLKSVNAVVIFDNVRATEVLQLASPDIYVKGGDYTEETLDREEYAALKKAQAQFRFIPFVGNFSTSNIIRSLRDNTPLDAAPSTAASSSTGLPADLNFIFSRRSIRKFQGRPVSKDAINAILQAGAAAPSARNMHPEHFIAVTEPDILVSLAKILPHGSFLKDSSAAILVCGNIDQAWDKNLFYMLQDCTAAIENILLAIQARNLGGCWLGVYPKGERVKNISEFFHLPKNIIPVSAIALGWPAEEKPPRTNLTDSMIHWNQY